MVNSKKSTGLSCLFSRFKNPLLFPLIKGDEKQKKQKKQNNNNIKASRYQTAAVWNGVQKVPFKKGDVTK